MIEDHHQTTDDVVVPSLSALEIHPVAGVIRVPLLSPEETKDLLLSGAVERNLFRLISRRPIIVDAIRSASASLYSVLERWLAQGTIPKKALSKLVYYTLRMAWQSTPFRYFATVGSVEFGPQTTLELCPLESMIVHRQRSIEKIDEFIAGLKRRKPPDSLRVFTNQLSFALGDRVIFLNPSELVRKGRGSTLRFDAAESVINRSATVDRLLSIARNGSTVADLINLLKDRLSEDDGRQFVGRLLRSGALISELDHPLVGDYESDLNASVCRAYPSQADDFQKLLSESNNQDHVDVVRHTVGDLGREVVDEIREHARIVVGMANDTALTDYVEAFKCRYDGESRLVPLLECLSKERGIGEVHSLDREPKVSDVLREEQRRLLLGNIASRALREGLPEVLLSECELRTLLVNHRLPAIPNSIDVAVFIAARSLHDVQAGRFTIVSSPFLACGRAGGMSARFMNVLPELRDAIESSLDTQVEAEVVFLPPDPVLKHILRRPNLVRHHICLGVAPVSGARALDVAKLYVGIDETGDMYLWSSELDTRVEPVETHVFNTAQYGHRVARFLSLLSKGRRLAFSGIPWKELGRLSYVPRLRYGRHVLSRALWRVRADALRNPDLMKAYRATYKMPDVVALVTSDHRLPMNISDPMYEELIASELRSNNTASLLFEEIYPSAEDMWLSDGVHRYASEFVISLSLTKQASGVPQLMRPVVAAGDRRQAPGSQWLFLKWYCSEQADGLIRRSLSPLVALLKDRYELDSWHFLRYADPTPHLRLRFKAVRDNKDILAVVLAYSKGLTEADTISKFSVDTYERELERYGERSIEFVETLFMISSNAALDAIAINESPRAPNRVKRAVITADRDIISRLPGGLRKRLVGILARKHKPLDQDQRAMLREALERRLEPNTITPGPDFGDLIAACDRDAERAAWILNNVLHMHYNRFGLHREGEHYARSLQWHVAVGREVLDRGILL
jgi:hypothetical protein